MFDDLGKPGTQKGNLSAWAREIDSKAPPYGFVSRLFPFDKPTRRYPFNKQDSIARLSFLEQCMHSPEVDEYIKELALDATVIDCTPVAKYLYEVSDQETWYIQKDFPNLAPPFETTWLECQAPQHVNSSEQGILPWSKSFPMTWACAVRGVDLWKQADMAEADPEVQAAIKEACLQVLARSDGDWLRFLRKHRLSVDASGEEIRAALEQETPRTRAMLAEFLPVRHVFALAEMGAWAELRRYMRDQAGAQRWRLDMQLVAKWRASADTYRIIGPLWQMQLEIMDNGAVVLDESGQPQVRTRAVGDMGAAIESFSRVAHVDSEQGGRVLYEAFSPLMNAQLLAISFLHCRNVTMHERTHAPAESKARAEAIQARAAQGERPFFRYHVLNIEPVRKVLADAGARPGGEGVKRALHIARGHFADYSNGRGLFGKYHGIVWRPDHVRGALGAGVQGKGYNVKAPGGA